MRICKRSVKNFKQQLPSSLLHCSWKAVYILNFNLKTRTYFLRKNNPGIYRWRRSLIIDNLSIFKIRGQNYGLKAWQQLLREASCIRELFIFRTCLFTRDTHVYYITKKYIYACRTNHQSRFFAFFFIYYNCRN